MVLFYSRINWENFPSVNTALNAINLNAMDYAVKTLDERTVELDTTKANQSVVLNTIQDWSMDEETGIITITKVNGEQIMFDLNIEKIPVKFELSEDGILSMTTDDGSVFKADIGALIPILQFENSDTIAVSVTEVETEEGITKKYSFNVKDGSITGDKLQPNYLADVTTQAQSANLSAQNANASAVSAEASAKRAEDMAGLVDVKIGSPTSAGILKPDGTTIPVTEDGAISVNKSTGVTSTIYDFGFRKPELKNVIGEENSFINTATLADIISHNNSTIAGNFRAQNSNINVYLNNMDSQISTIRRKLGSFMQFAKFELDGVLVADTEPYELTEATVYIMFVNSWLNTNGAFRGSNAYAIATNALAGSTSTAQAIPRIYQLGAVGTTGVRLTATAYNDPFPDGTPLYRPLLGIGSCTTACYVSATLYEIG